MGIGETVANHKLRATSIFAPDVVGGGSSHQPYGHDTFEAMYNFYSVKSATIDIFFAEAATGDNAEAPSMCGVWTSDAGTEIIDETLIREQPGSVSKLLADDTTVSVRTIYKRDDRFPAYSQGDLTADFGTSPSEAVQFHVFASKDGSFTAASSVTAYWKISYEVEMWNPKKLGSS